MSGYRLFADSQRAKRDKRARPKIFGRPTEDIGTGAQIVSAARGVPVSPAETPCFPGRIYLVPRHSLPVCPAEALGDPNSF